MSERNTPVVVIGSYNQDHAWQVDRVPQPGETRRGQGFHTGPGGKGFNQAVACVRQGVDTCFIGARGNDALGEGAVRTAEREGLTGLWQVCDDQPTGSACIVVDASGQNQIVVHLAANEALAPGFLRQQSEHIARARVLLTQMENNIEATEAALALGGEHGLLRVLNPAPIHEKLTASLLRQAEVVTPNEGEFALLARRFLDIDMDTDGVAAMDDTTLHAVARQLTDGTLVVTLGQHGCFVSHGAERHGDSGEHYRVSAEKVNAIDTTAAGDAFCGALAAGLSQLPQGSFAAAVRHANRVAALATERRGAAESVPTPDQVRARFEA
ncbi:ribokinase [Oleiagrimonas sp. C23AA]|uniref:ribokinase n=1 Tax=Oleiagrimonas sp. C23AA TaxID=2719047 RepID=UPI00141F561A|nr:ribokinase [Oleiagrimonas sp. C23AA]NII09891.1 ribokinase [Oleiagrimonas sp. C23AA]